MAYQRPQYRFGGIALTRFRQTRRVAAAAMLLAVFGAVSCESISQNPQSRETPMGRTAAKSAPNPVRHDLDPLTKRFPALGTPVTASWVSGEMGDLRVPGPSTYWLDSIVELHPAMANELKDKYRPVPTTDRPEVWTTLTNTLPPGGYLTSDALDAAFSSARINAKAFLATNTPVIVITALGQ